MRQPDSSLPRTGQDHTLSPYEPELGEVPSNDLTEEDLESVNKTGTTTVGITTAEGVVIATDMRASLGGRFVSNKNVQKVGQIHPTAALTADAATCFASSLDMSSSYSCSRVP